MASKYKESKIKEEVMDGDDYDVYPRSLKNDQKDFSGLTIGDYLVIEPVSISNYLSMFPIPSPGWICQNTKTGYYKIFTHLALNKIYIQYCSDKKHFGMEYVSSDFVSTKLTPDQFRKDFLFAVESECANKEDWYYKEQYLKYNSNIEKYVKNVCNNIETLTKIDKCAFEAELNRIVEKYHFKEVNDISSYKKCLYLVVLDEYRQFYIGKAVTSLKNRMRKHWTAKIIPFRQLWNGGFDYSRVKFDNYKIFDSTRIFVCESIQDVINENLTEAQDKRIEVTNTFGIERFEEMDELAKAERIVINNSKCMYCLSDRTPLITCPAYKYLEDVYGLSRDNLLVKHYLRLDEANPFYVRGDMWENYKNDIDEE